MSLLKRRPGLRFELPAVITLGEELRGALVLKVSEPVEINGIAVEITAGTLQFVRSQQAVYPSPFEVSASLGRATTLEPGEHRYPFALMLPADQAPTYRSKFERRRFMLRASVSIPWWVDASLSKELNVAPAHPARVESRPDTASSEEALSHHGVIELGLDADALHPGELLSGRVALLRADPKVVRGVELLLLESVGDGIRDHFNSYVDQRLVIAYIPLEDLVDEQPVAFDIELPASLKTSFLSTDRQRFHEVAARLDLKQRLDKQEPWAYCALRVLPATTIIEASGEQLPPIGQEREALDLQRAAEQHGAVVRRGRIRKDLGAVRVAVSRGLDEKREPQLVGRLTFLPLGLDLRIDGLGLSDLLGPVLAPWLSEAYAHGRDPAQTAQFLEPLRSPLSGFPGVRASDTSLTVTQPGAEPLATFVGRVIALAQALGQAIAAMPPPTVLVDELPLWRALAEQMGGELRLGSCTVEGVLEGHTATIEPRWGDKGEVSGTRLRLTPAEPLDPSHHAALLGPDPLGVPEVARPLVPRLLAPDERLDIDGQGLTLTTPRRVQEASDPLARLRLMANLLRAYEHHGSPYR